ncbi:hypothetical protein BDZ94DRAFT_1230476 [Collybia nuda]|uniref:Methyltransferase domain-containing protein n=1 Tax=Collybia nuda TaxID=64659 RepID=A0A9P5XUA2_9AGAR|nr:hypothetical protein BDZ94DRAFT_1230476 [Collybia nuda]
MSSPPDDQYLFRGNETERHRLDNQYRVIQKCFDKGPVTLSGSLHEGRVNKVLDIAAGSLAWTMDVARSVEPSKVELYACDISSDSFPHKSVIDMFGITTFIHDVTKPFPEGMRGQFDVVNMRLLLYALTEGEWKLALKNVHDVIKPGGHLYLFEFDAPWYPGEDVNPNAVASWLPTLNKILDKHAKAVGYIDNLTERLPKILRDNSFTIKDQLVGPVPFGMAGKTCRSINGASLAGDEDFMGGVTKLILRRVMIRALAGGYLEDEDGNPVTTEEGHLQLLERFVKGFDVYGVLFKGIHVTAVRN